jgi:hypothetical protein
MNGLWGVLRHQVLMPLAVPITLVLLALVLRSVRALWFRLRQGGFPPIVIHAADDSRDGPDCSPVRTRAEAARRQACAGKTPHRRMS